MAERWLFTVTGPDRKIVQSQLGRGHPPKTINWTPDTALVPGDYRARLTVVGASVVADSNAILEVGTPGEKPTISRTVAVDGHAAPIDGAGRFKKDVATRLKRPIVVDMASEQ